VIDRKKLRELHSSDLPLHVLEQDYVQALFLQKLYRESENLVFKGGTFLKHAYGLDRFSEDLDFTLAEDQGDVVSVLQKSANSLSEYGVEAKIDDINENDISITCRLRYRGPLFDGSDRSKGSIEIDVSKRDDILLDPEWTRLFFDYPEISVVNALGLQKKELLAEKLRALSTRNKARDLYDCWYLVNQGAEPDIELFKKKMDVVNTEHELKVSVTEEAWKDDLNIFLENPPDFGKVRHQLVDALENSGFSDIVSLDRQD